MTKEKVVKEVPKKELPESPPKKEPEPQKKTVLTKQPTLEPPSEIKEEDPETLSDDDPPSEPEAVVEKPLWLPSILAVRATQVPPIKYKNRSITFEIDFDTGKKTEAFDPVLSSMSRAASQKKSES